jgi:hypothetical protein
MGMSNASFENMSKLEKEYSKKLAESAKDVKNPVVRLFQFS